MQKGDRAKVTAEVEGVYYDPATLSFFRYPVGETVTLLEDVEDKALLATCSWKGKKILIPVRGLFSL